jgi:hypothetical protein
MLINWDSAPDHNKVNWPDAHTVQLHRLNIYNLNNELLHFQNKMMKWMDRTGLLDYLQDSGLQI